MGHDFQAYEGYENGFSRSDVPELSSMRKRLHVRNYDDEVESQLASDSFTGFAGYFVRTAEAQFEPYYRYLNFYTSEGGVANLYTKSFDVQMRNTGFFQMLFVVRP